MAKLQIGILGAISGAVGTVVGAVVRGVATIRAKPKKSTKPPVQSQINQRSKFGLMTGFLANAKSEIEIGYQSYNNVMSPMNAAVQFNLKNAITGVTPDFKVDYPNVQISKGSLLGSSTITVAAVAGAMLNITWDVTAELSESDQLLRSTDEGVIMLYAENGKRFLHSIGTITRGDGLINVHLPKVFVGDKLHTWFFFMTADGKSVSTSQYLGSPLGIA